MSRQASRDIQREQIRASTDAQLTDRVRALHERYGISGYPLAQLSEFHAICDEVWRRAYFRAKERGEVAA
jgi:hypothetical protein